MRKFYKISRMLILSLMVLTLVFMGGCGEENKESKETKKVMLNFRYDTQSGIVWKDDAKILIDGKEIGIAKYGEKDHYVEVDLTEGKHKVQLVGGNAIRKNKSNKVKISIMSDTDLLKFEISQSSLWGVRLKLTD